MQIKLRVHIRRCNGNTIQDEPYYENVELSGYFRKWVNQSETDSCVSDDDDKLSLKSGMSLSQSQVSSFAYCIVKQCPVDSS